ncbi:Tetratricopeptide repeat-containing protein [Actinokineospora alba]|uniref:Tetratricopeptide repeat-containing protein n=1 Tax=Actinokineospora alba TaxID=504798 RepID=A0A1H0VRH4_9PSEU|nr:tetratricopeptide repeat protein [Actinokineospora alba]TDP70157.1 tetratricopeptide repeat protein [Actinokineospora alba]SDI37775.1 Tetratricopeptide repeat-containing protein [Actinokineospora alba]SDP80851.1 Tetratricopeptide repeat-containing protein [Actinokineospora alba]
MSTSEPDESRDRVAHMVHSTESMPAGQAKCEALERAARAADAAGFTDYAVAARLILVNAYREIRRYDLMLTPFAWLRTTERLHPESFDEWALHQFNWMHKWLPTGLLGDPRFSLEQIGSVVEELAERYRQQGYSLHPVHDKLRAIAHHIGDTEAADAHFAAWRAAEPDEMSDCAACVVDSQVGYFVSRKRFAEAIDAARSVLTEPSDCAEQPHGVMASLLEAYLATGRLDEAARAHLVSYRVVRDTPQARSALHAHLRFCALTGNAARGLEILTRNLDVLADAPSPKVRQDFAAAAALLLSRVPDRADRMFRVGDSALTGEELWAHCVDTARSTAKKFDERNGTDAASRRVEETLALPDAQPIVLAVPGTVVPLRDSEPVDLADPVDVAERACAAMDGGGLFTGARLLAALPADLDGLLPDGLAARVAVHRTWLARRATPEELIDSLNGILVRLTAAGEDAAAARLHSFLADLLSSVERPDDAASHAALALEIAHRAGDPIGVMRAHLATADLLAETDPDRAASEVDEAERIAVESAPNRLGGVRKARAELLERKGDLEGSLKIIEALAADSERWPESTRLAVSGHRARLLANLGRVEESVEQFAHFVEVARTYPGPWVAEALMQSASLLDQTDLAGSHLPVLIDAVAAARTYLTPGAVGQACLHLSAGYLAAGRDVEAAETLEEALRLMPTAFVGPVADIHYRLALACRNLGEFDGAANHFDAVLATADDGDHGLRAHVLFQLGDARLELGDYPGAAASFRESAATWQIADNPVAAAESLVKLAHAAGLDDLQAGLLALDEAADLLPDDSVPGALDQQADVIGFRVALLAHHQRFAEALEVNQRTEEYAVRLGNSEWHAFLAGRAARLRLDLGQLAAAESDARRAAALLTADAGDATVGAVLGTLARTLEEQAKPVDTDPLVRELTDRLSH